MGVDWYHAKTPSREARLVTHPIASTERPAPCASRPVDSFGSPRFQPTERVDWLVNQESQMGFGYSMASCLRGFARANQGLARCRKEVRRGETSSIWDVSARRWELKASDRVVHCGATEEISCDVGIRLTLSVGSLRWRRRFASHETGRMVGWTFFAVHAIIYGALMDLPFAAVQRSLRAMVVFS